MARLSAGLALASLAALAGCGLGEPETPERCIERFRKLLGERRLDRPGFGDARFQPIFTYDMTRMEGGLEELVGTGDELIGLRMTISHGADGAALDAFYQAEVPPKGAIFAADDYTLYRVSGMPGSRDETLVAGCRQARPKASLVRIQWIPLPSGTDEQARPIDSRA